MSEGHIVENPVWALKTAAFLQAKFGARADVFTEVGSTSDYLRDLIRTGDSSFESLLFCAAGVQTSGRGTHGRTWRSADNSCLFSFAQRVSPSLVQHHPGLIPLGVGCCAAEALRRCSVPVGIKWPNDLWLYGGKVGGILCEVVRDSTGAIWVSIGVGLNVAGVRVGQTDRGWPVRSIAEGKIIAHCETPDFKSACANEIISATFQWLSNAPLEIERLPSQWMELDEFFGKKVIWKTKGELCFGIDCGINTMGALLVRKLNGMWVTLSTDSASLLPLSTP